MRYFSSPYTYSFYKYYHVKGGTIMNTSKLKSMHYVFGKNLCACRKKKGLTQESLGKNTGVSRAYINRLEKGKGNPTFKTVMRLADVLGIDASFLLFGIRYKD